jgi:hypothetical protein
VTLEEYKNRNLNEMLQVHLQIIFLAILLAEYLHLLKEDSAKWSQSYKTFYWFSPFEVGQISV